MSHEKDGKSKKCWRCKTTDHTTDDKSCPKLPSSQTQTERLRWSFEDPMLQYLQDQERKDQFERVKEMQALLESSTSSDSSSSASGSDTTERKHKRRKKKKHKSHKRQKVVPCDSEKSSSHNNDTREKDSLENNTKAKWKERTPEKEPPTKKQAIWVERTMEIEPPTKKQKHRHKHKHKHKHKHH